MLKQSTKISSELNFTPVELIFSKVAGLPQLSATMQINWQRMVQTSLQYCKPSTASRVCIIVSNSSNSLCAWTRQCAHEISPLFLNNYYVTTVIPVEPAGKASLIYSYKQTRLMGPSFSIVLNTVENDALASFI